MKSILRRLSVFQNFLFPMDPKATQLMRKSRKNQVKEVRTNGSKWAPEIRLQSLARRTSFRPQSLAFLGDTSGSCFSGIF